MVRRGELRNPVGAQKPGWSPRNPVGKKPGLGVQKPGWQKTGFRCQETRLAKNRVSVSRNPVGKKPGFDISRALASRNRVFSQKPGFLDVAGRKKPGWQKTGFQYQETRLAKNRVSVVRFLAPRNRLAKNRVSVVGKKPGFLDVAGRKKPGWQKTGFQKPGFLS